MDQTKTSVGIIGCGGIARQHLKGYKASGIDPVGFVDLDPAAAEALRAESGSGKVFPDFRALIESGEVDAVSVCVPPVGHEEPAVFALEHDVHVLCEKPLAHTVESAERIVKASKNSSALLMTGFCHRFRPAILKIRELVRGGAIGPVVLFTNAFYGPAESMKDKWFSKKSIAGGGSMLDAGCHSVDLFRFLVGEVEEHQMVAHRHLEGTDVEDAAILSVKATNGAIGALITSWVAGAGRFFVEVVGRKGRIVYNYGETIQLTTLDGKDETLTEPLSNGIQEEIAHFLSSIQNGKAPSVTGEDGLRAVEIVLSATEGVAL